MPPTARHHLPTSSHSPHAPRRHVRPPSTSPTPISTLFATFFSLTLRHLPSTPYLVIISTSHLSPSCTTNQLPSSSPAAVSHLHLSTPTVVISHPSLALNQLPSSHQLPSGRPAGRQHPRAGQRSPTAIPIGLARMAENRSKYLGWDHPGPPTGPRRRPPAGPHGPPWATYLHPRANGRGR